MKENPIPVNLTSDEKQNLIIAAHESVGLIKKPKTALEILAETISNDGKDSS